MDSRILQLQEEEHGSPRKILYQLSTSFQQRVDRYSVSFVQMTKDGIDNFIFGLLLTIVSLLCLTMAL